MAQQRGRLLGSLEECLQPRLEAMLCAQQQCLLLIVRRAVPRGVGALQQQRQGLGVARLRGARGGVTGGIRVEDGARGELRMEGEGRGGVGG